ncbi:hypothetical protein JOC85_001885 [Bacillus mesophilus]|uniref:Uncharacterized protein n=1 Tax=Bacillus mesophilus TaxID=1808955 RepID=A0A6M0Q4P0_9BACI|nr:hypothetical protein [Bacillus mesophilus]MBM7661113.1 hypothetical protein [Bacillus mesophilus]NEY71357.1 hypothetical protein [Bacillus mesophilus]
MNFLTYYLEMFFVMAIIILVISFLNKKGVSVGSYKKNFPLKFFLAMILLGIFIRISYLFIGYEYFLKETVEPSVGIIIIYIIIAIINRNGFLDKQNINDWVAAILILSGIAYFLLMIFN